MPSATTPITTAFFPTHPRRYHVPTPVDVWLESVGGRDAQNRLLAAGPRFSRTLAQELPEDAVRALNYIWESHALRAWLSGNNSDSGSHDTGDNDDAATSSAPTTLVLGGEFERRGASTDAGYTTEEAVPSYALAVVAKFLAARTTSPVVSYSVPRRSGAFNATGHRDLLVSLSAQLAAQVWQRRRESVDLSFLAKDKRCDLARLPRQDPADLLWPFYQLLNRLPTGDVVYALVDLGYCEVADDVLAALVELAARRGPTVKLLVADPHPENYDRLAGTRHLSLYVDTEDRAPSAVLDLEGWTYSVWAPVLLPRSDGNNEVNYEGLEQLFMASGEAAADDEVCYEGLERLFAEPEPGLEKLTIYEAIRQLLIEEP